MRKKRLSIKGHSCINLALKLQCLKDESSVFAFCVLSMILNRSLITFQAKIENLERNTAQYLAWQSIIDAMRMNRDASAIANEVIQHLTALSGTKVKVTLEIEAEIPDGTPDDVVRTVMENCKTLKFQDQSFEVE